MFEHHHERASLGDALGTVQETLGIVFVFSNLLKVRCGLRDKAGVTNGGDAVRDQVADDVELGAVQLDAVRPGSINCCTLRKASSRI